MNTAFSTTANGATGGDVPVDGALYPVNGSVTVMGNPGGLVGTARCSWAGA